MVALRQGQLAGFLSAYLPPAHPDVLFVWQVAVHREARGLGLGAAMLRHVLARVRDQGVRVLETTVSPSNAPSRRLFAALARELEAPLAEHEGFAPTLFGGSDHEAERLLRIGPF